MPIDPPGAPGASLAFTTTDPIVTQALALMNDGKFKEAQSLLASDDGHADESVRRAREEAKEIIRRVRRDYSLDPADLLAKVKSDIPDVSPDDLERWRTAAEAQARVIDGKIKYFRREPANLFRFSEDAKHRREANRKSDEQKRTEGWTLVGHLANVIKEAEQTGKTEVVPIRHRMRYGSLSRRSIASRRTSSSRPLIRKRSRPPSRHNGRSMSSGRSMIRPSR